MGAELADPQPGNQSNCLLFLQMTLNLIWTSDPVQKTLRGVKGVPHAAAAIASSWGIPNTTWPHLIWKGVTCWFRAPLSSEAARPGIGVGNLPSP